MKWYTLVKFADDRTSWLLDSSTTIVSQNTFIQIDFLNSWLKNSFLDLNVTTKELVFDSRKEKKVPFKQSTIDQQPISSSSQC